MKTIKFLAIFSISIIFVSWIIPHKQAADQKDTFQIISFRKVLDAKSSSGPVDMKVYNSWNLNKEEILDILQSSHTISGTELDLSYLVLPYWYKGQLLNKGIKYNYEINAGSFILLTSKDSIIKMACTEKSKYKYFLEHENQQ